MLYGNLKMWIGGEWVGSRSGNSIEVLNPATGEPVDTAPRGTVEDAREAIDAAHSAFAVWSEWTQAKRAEVLYRAIHVTEIEGQFSRNSMGGHELVRIAGSLRQAEA